MNSPKQLEVTRREADAGLLLELAVGGRLEVLPGIDVAACQPPLLGVDAGVLVALLQEDPAITIDEDDSGETVLVGRRDEGVLLHPRSERRSDQRRGRHRVEVRPPCGVDEDHLPALVALQVAVAQRRTRHEGMEVEGAAVVGDQLEAAQVGEVLGRDPDPGLLGQLAHGTAHRLLVTLEATPGEAPHVGPERGMLVAFLHEDPPARVDQRHLHEVGAGRRG